MTLTAAILGEPALDVVSTKDGEDSEEDDRRGRALAARAGPGAGAWAGRGPETGRALDGAGNWEAENRAG